MSLINQNLKNRRVELAMPVVSEVVVLLPILSYLNFLPSPVLLLHNYSIVSNHYTKDAKNALCESLHRSKSVKENIFQTNRLFTQSIPLLAASLPVKAALAFSSPINSHFPSGIQNIFAFGHQIRIGCYEHPVFKIYF